ncbi:ATP-binding protein [Actinomadura craniellae]|uniref:ATP-binding protein n=1 Tax=Actinomadura craniellae TaxID=2231787 RepID=A0A365H9C9_9ACTN|nr:ATP-binding protein [Actinomadura craniellae]RAY14883.1 ATP-binding protein [Actinomadura craniellae]
METAVESTAETTVLPARPEAVRSARRFVGAAFARWGLDDSAARLVVSELATNAVTHGSAGGGPVVVRTFLSEDGNPVIEVWDRSPERPVVPPPNHAAESGRGLFLVEQLADQWGVRPLNEGGKVVWAVITPAAPERRALRGEALEQA